MVVLKYAFFFYSLDVSEPKPYSPLSATNKPNTESSSSAIPAQSPSLSGSQEPTVKPGEYPFKRGEFNQRCIPLYLVMHVLKYV